MRGYVCCFKRYLKMGKKLEESRGWIRRVCQVGRTGIWGCYANEEHTLELLIYIGYQLAWQRTLASFPLLHSELAQAIHLRRIEWETR